jgi:hypothetical protein
MFSPFSKITAAELMERKIMRFTPNFSPQKKKLYTASRRSKKM